MQPFIDITAKQQYYVHLMKTSINIMPQKARLKFASSLSRNSTEVDKFCLELTGDNKTTTNTLYTINASKNALIASTEFDPYDYDGNSEKKTMYGALYECSCLDVYNRFADNNLRIPYETAIIEWCVANAKDSVTILSLGSGGLLQEAIIAERLKSLGITPFFICVDREYQADPEIERLRQEKLRSGPVDPNDFHEWMLTASAPILLYHLTCMRAIEAFRAHADFQTFCNIGDLAFAIENNLLQRMPDLVIAIDILAEFHVPIDTRDTSEVVTFHGKLQGYIGKEKYAFEYADGENGINRDWGWYNFTAALLSSGLLKGSPELSCIAAAYGMIKWFKGVNEVRCEIPLPNVGCKVLGLRDSDPEVMILREMHVRLVQKHNLPFYTFPQRRIVVSHKVAGFIFPENMHKFFASAFFGEKAEITEYQVLLDLAPAFKDLDQLPQGVVRKYLEVAREVPARDDAITEPPGAAAIREPDALPSFARFKANCPPYCAPEMLAATLVLAGALALAYRLGS